MHSELLTLARVGLIIVPTIIAVQVRFVRGDLNDPKPPLHCQHHKSHHCQRLHHHTNHQITIITRIYVHYSE